MLRNIRNLKPRILTGSYRRYLLPGQSGYHNVDPEAGWLRCERGNVSGILDLSPPLRRRQVLRYSLHDAPSVSTRRLAKSRSGPTVSDLGAWDRTVPVSFTILSKSSGPAITPVQIAVKPYQMLQLGGADHESMEIIG